MLPKAHAEEDLSEQMRSLGLPTSFKTTKKPHWKPVKKKKKKGRQQSSGQIGRRSSSGEPSAMGDLVLMESGNPLDGDGGIVGCSNAVNDFVQGDLDARDGNGEEWEEALGGTRKHVLGPEVNHEQRWLDGNVVGPLVGCSNGTVKDGSMDWDVVEACAKMRKLGLGTNEREDRDRGEEQNGTTCGMEVEGQSLPGCVVQDLHSVVPSAEREMDVVMCDSCFTDSLLDDESPTPVADCFCPSSTGEMRWQRDAAGSSRTRRTDDRLSVGRGKYSGSGHGLLRKRSGSSGKQMLVDPKTAAMAREQVPRRLFKYWLQRYSLFSKFDQGVQMDGEGWYSATPECIARHQASRCRCDVIVDAFTGVGGNAIQFALAGALVVAFDLSPLRIGMARRNAEVYGVSDKIDFICGDFFEIGGQMKADTVFISPPWGGPHYQQLEHLEVGDEGSDLGSLVARSVALGLKMTASSAGGKANGVVLFLPKNSNLRGFKKLAPGREDLQVELVEVNGWLKALTLYVGRFY